MAKKVLLVDDVTMFLELQKEYLQLSAVDVLTARDGKEALEICLEQRPVLVCMDLHMPIMNGAECCRAIKSHPKLKSTGVILITAENKPQDRDICLAAGCDGFLTKPLDRVIYLEEARKLLPAIDRRDKRVACQLRAKYRVFGLTLSGNVLNLSQNGAYLATDHEVEKGALLDLIFALPDPHSSIIQLRCRVAWLNTKHCRHKETYPTGFGVEFLSNQEQTVRDLAGFIDQEPASFT